MHLDIESIRDFTKPAHIALGGVILLTGLLQMALPKFGKRHRLLGQVYFWAMIFSFITSFPISIAKENYFLSMVGLFSLYLSFTGGRFAMVKNAARLPDLDRIGILFFALSSLLMLLFGITMLNQGYIGGGIIILVFSGIFLSGTVRDVYYVFIKRDHLAMYGGMNWMFNHIGRMIGSYIAAVTAFLVNVQPFGSSMVNWLLPSLIGSFVISRFLRHYKTKYKS